MDYVSGFSSKLVTEKSICQHQTVTVLNIINFSVAYSRDNSKRYFSGYVSSGYVFKKEKT